MPEVNSQQSINSAATFVETHFPPDFDPVKAGMEIKIIRNS
jgi:hypothetical protein